MTPELYIGLMSGTSMDGIDAVLVDFNASGDKLIAAHSHPIPDDLLVTLKRLCDTSNGEINLMGAADRRVAQVFAEAVNGLLEKATIDASKVVAIGSHGQTIRHYPQGEQGFSLQIGDGNTIAVNTNIDVIADFRRKDIALGGQGAPLVPAYHQAVFNKAGTNRFILNIGGMANFSFLPADTSQTVQGFDTGPGNVLLDEWCKQHKGKPYDKDAEFALSGQVNLALLDKLLSFAYFAEPAPKSTGREVFNLNWIEEQLASFDETLPPQDVQATLVALSAKTIANEINKLAGSGELYVCGGGAHNPALMAALADELNDFSVATTDELGIAADWVEAIAFAWLAYAYNNKIPGNIPKVTGASRAAVLGVYFPSQ